MVGAIVLGIVAGYVGRLLMPGRDKMGFIATIVLGVGGAIVGFLVFTELLGVGDDQMFDLGGLLGAIIGVMILYFIVSWVAVTAARLVFGSIFRLVAGGGGAMSLSAVLTSVIVAAIQTVFGILVATFIAKLYQALIYAHATARA